MDTPKPNFDRLATTLRHEEPDRVPLVEILVAHEIQSRFLGRTVTAGDVASQIEFWSRAGYDYVPVTVGMMTPGGVTQDSQISKALLQFTEETHQKNDDAWNLERTSWIHDMEGFERFPWDLVSEIDVRSLEETNRRLPPGMRTVVLSGKLFTLAWMLMGFENFCASLIAEPRLVEAVFDRVSEIQGMAIDAVRGYDSVAAVWAVDDLAYGSGPIIDPPFLQHYVFSRYRRIAEQCHDSGWYFFFHSDGVLWDLMDDLLGVGIDALHPIDPTCMDIREMKNRVGDRITLFGNISNEALMTAPPGHIAETVKERLKHIAPGGGYGLGSGNSVPSWAAFENYTAMRETALTYGRYPIQV